MGGGDHPPYVPSATGFGDAHFGFKFAIETPAAWAVQLDWKAPLGYERAPTYFSDDSTDINVAEQTSNPKLGEGQQDVSGILHFGTTIGQRGFVQAAGGYTYRFEAPENLIVLSADADLRVTGPILVGGQYRGQLANTSDNPTRDSDLHQVRIISWTTDGPVRVVAPHHVGEERGPYRRVLRGHELQEHQARPSAGLPGEAMKQP